MSVGYRPKFCGLVHQSPVIWDLYANDEREGDIQLQAEMLQEETLPGARAQFLKSGRTACCFKQLTFWC